MQSFDEKNTDKNKIIMIKKFCSKPHKGNLLFIMVSVDS